MQLFETVPIDYFALDVSRFGTAEHEATAACDTHVKQCSKKKV